ncbi:MAG: 3-dehydroquinate synthase, partial [Chloroflexi bacterium]|nr:3-dehydroquinate synthase [Chloroflexota bacterium]
AGLRAALNLGHTVGHALERASDYRLRHGEAVGIGTIVEARLAERMGLAQPGLAEEIAAVLSGLGMPTHFPPGIQPDELLPWMKVDKKRAGGAVRFALPVRIGEVKTGVVVEEGLLRRTLQAEVQA